MNKAGGFITLHRQILDWEWYGDTNTFRLFIHILLKANFTEGKFEGRLIHRGQLVTSLTSLASQTRLSVRQVRVSLEHLLLTGEVTSESCNRYRIITVVKYDEYQSRDKQNDKQMTGETAGGRQADDKQMTGETAGKRQQYNNDNNIINNGTMEQGNKHITPRPNVNDSFDLFWEEYPKKVAKQRAMAAWKKVKPDSETLNAIMEGLCKWKASYEWQKENGRYIPYPASWLNDRRWEDDVRSVTTQIPKPTPVKQVVAQQYEQRDYGDEDAEAMRRQIEMIRRMQNG